MLERFRLRMRYLGVAAASLLGGIGGVLPAAGVHPTTTLDQAEVATDRKVLQERVERVRAVLRNGKPTDVDRRRHFTQWYNWNNWYNGWNNWRNW
jgi:hypothetical protein